MLSSAVVVRLDNHSRKKVRTTKIADTIEARVPTMRVTAKPRTGPVPNWKSSNAVMIVRHVGVDDRVHRSMETLIRGEPRRLAECEFLADALEDQHVGVDRDADRQHQAGKPRKGERRIERGQHTEREEDVHGQTDHGEHAGEAVVADHDEDHQQRAEDAGRDALADRVGAQRRTDGALLQHLERHREGAGLEGEREVLRLLDRLVAEGDLPAAIDPRVDHGRAALDAAVKHDRHEIAGMTSSLGAEPARAGAIELEHDHRLVVDRIDLRRGRGEVLAR